MKTFLKKIKAWQVFLFLILVAAAFLRFWNIKDSLMFQADQGRDVLVVSKIFKEADPVFIGPVTSIGNMYLGPFYYYFMLPFLMLSYPSPMGPAYGVAILGLITVFLLFKFTEKVFDRKTALIATLFFALSSTVIEYSRFSWNPNIAPFFGLLMFYFTYMAWKKDTKYWLVVAAAFSLIIQLHYVALLSAGGAGIIFLVQAFEKFKKKNKKENKIFIKHILLSILIFLVSLTPLMLFDLKHDFRNVKSLTGILFEEESFDLNRKKGRTGINAITKYFTVDLRDKTSQVLFETSFDINEVNHPLLYLSIALVIFYLIKNKKKLNDGEIVLAAFLIPTIFGIALYQHNLYTHYISYTYPLIYIFYGIVFAKIKNKYLFAAIFTPFFTYFLFNNINRYPIDDHSWTIDDVEKVANSIYQRVEENEKYNVVLLSESKDLYAMTYRYYLSTKENQPTLIEEHHSAEKLFIINEEKKEKDLVNLPIYEIQVFPDKIIEEVYQIEGGPEITVLSRAETAYNEE